MHIKYIAFREYQKDRKMLKAKHHKHVANILELEYQNIEKCCTMSSECADAHQQTCAVGQNWNFLTSEIYGGTNCMSNQANFVSGFLQPKFLSTHQISHETITDKVVGKTFICKFFHVIVF